MLKWGGTPLFDASERPHRRQDNPQPALAQSATAPKPPRARNRPTVVVASTGNLSREYRTAGISANPPFPTLRNEVQHAICFEKRRGDREIWKGAAAGAVGGLVASWVMNEFSSVLTKITEASTNGNKRKSQGNGQQQEDPTIVTAEKITETFAGIRLSKDQKKIGGTVVHYAFGATMGAVYGAATEIRPEVHSLAGLPYGMALFLVADEVAVPLLGLAKKPTEYPLSSHLSGLGQHLVYGVTTELVRRTLREKS